jgi:hypothetical protein
MVADEHAARRRGKGHHRDRREKQASPGQRRQRLAQQQEGRESGEERRGAAHHREDQGEIAALQRLDEAELVEEMGGYREQHRAPGPGVRQRDEKGRGKDEDRRARRQQGAADKYVGPHLDGHVGRRESHCGEQAES